MCDPACARRFTRVELSMGQMAMDMKWIKKTITMVALLAFAALGIDVTGVV